MNPCWSAGSARPASPRSPTSASSAWTTTWATRRSSPATKKPKGKTLPPAKKLVNQLIAAERAVCEHAFAHLKNWRVLTRLRLDVKWATRLVRALMVLNQHGIAR
ncbi:transposase family protein [Streptomyces sp. LN549]|uniref:transposase family protein n=1 Tax=Streptomyces sp. LN549 TaxID=3112979 RepID=UPI003714245D